MVMNMGKWFRCPLCGHLRPAKNFDKIHPIDTFNQVGLGRAKGFRYDPIEDVGIVQNIKIKIKILYKKYFEPVIPSITLTPGIILKPNLIVLPVVKT